MLSLPKTILLATLAAGLAACGGADEEGPTLAAGETNTLGGSINGNVAVIDLTVDGVQLVGADGDTSGDTGHLHVFVDRDPVAVGEVIPKEAGIIHTTNPFIEVTGLGIGNHRLTVVLGDGEHRRIHDSAEYVAEFEMAGPSVQVTAPPSVGAGESVTLDVAVEGVQIVGADGDTSGDTGHLHVVVDRHPRDVAGMGEAFPATDDVIHTTDTTIEVADLEPGVHTLWVVLGDGTHTLSWGDPVADMVTVTVQE